MATETIRAHHAKTCFFKRRKTNRRQWSHWRVRGSAPLLLSAHNAPHARRLCCGRWSLHAMRLLWAFVSYKGFWRPKHGKLERWGKYFLSSGETSVPSWSNFDVHLRRILRVYWAACRLNVIFFKKSHFFTRGDTDPSKILVSELDFSRGAYLTSISIYRHVCGELECLK